MKRKEILAKCCGYRNADDMEDNDNITVAECLDAMELYAIEYHEHQLKNPTVSDSVSCNNCKYFDKKYNEYCHDCLFFELFIPKQT